MSKKISAYIFGVLLDGKIRDVLEAAEGKFHGDIYVNSEHYVATTLLYLMDELVRVRASDVPEAVRMIEQARRTLTRKMKAAESAS